MFCLGWWGWAENKWDIHLRCSSSSQSYYEYLPNKLYLQDIPLTRHMYPTALQSIQHYSNKRRTEILSISWGEIITAQTIATTLLLPPLFVVYIVLCFLLTQCNWRPTLTTPVTNTFAKVLCFLLTQCNWRPHYYPPSQTLLQKFFLLNINVTDRASKYPSVPTFALLQTV